MLEKRNLHEIRNLYLRATELQSSGSLVSSWKTIERLTVKQASREEQGIIFDL